jgi:hypothetical protein
MRLFIHRQRRKKMNQKRKWIALLLLFAIATSTVGCITIKVGGKAQLAPSTEEGTKVAQKRCWFILFGLVPLGDNSIDSYIPATAAKVRVETKWTLLDIVMNLFTELLTIVSFTAEIYEVP